MTGATVPAASALAAAGGLPRRRRLSRRRPTYRPRAAIRLVHGLQRRLRRRVRVRCGLAMDVRHRARLELLGTRRNRDDDQLDKQRVPRRQRQPQRQGHRQRQLVDVRPRPDHERQRRRPQAGSWKSPPPSSSRRLALATGPRSWMLGPGHSGPENGEIDIMEDDQLAIRGLRNRPLRQPTRAGRATSRTVSAAGYAPAPALASPVTTPTR